MDPPLHWSNSQYRAHLHIAALSYMTFLFVCFWSLGVLLVSLFGFFLSEHRNCSLSVSDARKRPAIHDCIIQIVFNYLLLFCRILHCLREYHLKPFFHNRAFNDYNNLDLYFYLWSHNSFLLQTLFKIIVDYIWEKRVMWFKDMQIMVGNLK